VSKFKALTALNADEAALLFAPLRPTNGILCAVSGGPDSIALLGLLIAWCREAEVKLAAATIDHGLRAESTQEAQEVAFFCEKQRISHRILRWEGTKPAAGLQEAARDARYALLGAEAKRLGFSHVATAHTLDDQAETVLMRLAHGSGTDGLAGIKYLTKKENFILARPFLSIAKTRLIATCTANEWPCIDDPSNINPQFERVRWRKLMPDLAEEGLTAMRLSAFAARNAAISEALDWQVEQWMGCVSQNHTQAIINIDFKDLSGVPTQILARFLLRAVPQDGTGEPQRLARYETLAARINAALAQNMALRATISGKLINLDRNAQLTITPEPTRRRGRTASKP
jgi:tRNA(Ile)-lysidine synthase